MASRNCEKVGVFFALGNTMLEAKLLDMSELPAAGSLVELKERSLHVRSMERCTRPCCATEPTRMFRVVSTKTFGSDERKALQLCQEGRADEVPPEALQQVVEDRVWEESVCRNHEWCSLFDTYTLDGYLGLSDFEEPHFAVIVDVESVDG